MPLPTALQTCSISPHPRHPSLSPDPILHSAIMLPSVLLLQQVLRLLLFSMAHSLRRQAVGWRMSSVGV